MCPLRRIPASLKRPTKTHHIAKDWEMPCMLEADDKHSQPHKNVQLEAKHPADPFEAFAALVAEGQLKLNGLQAERD